MDTIVGTSAARIKMAWPVAYRDAAMLRDGDAFSLVPCKPMLEERLGQPLSAIVRDGRVDWTHSRQRDLSL